MHLGYMTMNGPYEPHPNLLGPGLIERGFDSLWMGEHSHIPVASAADYPMAGGMPEFYTRMMDPLIALAVAATAAPELRVGTAVALPLERETLSFANEIATLDLLTGGRLTLGVGVGWNRLEFENQATVAWRDRYEALAERIEVLRLLWSAERPQFDGRFHRFDEMWCDPKPTGGTVRILAGGSGRRALREASRWADGWMPMDLGLSSPDRVVDRLREVAETNGRTDPMPSVVLLMIEPTVERLVRYRELGVDTVVVGAGVERGDSTWQALDTWADLWSRC